jgi:hypothetical protein
VVSSFASHNSPPLILHRVDLDSASKNFVSSAATFSSGQAIFVTACGLKVIVCFLPGVKPADNWLQPVVPDIIPGVNSKIDRVESGINWPSNSFNFHLSRKRPSADAAVRWVLPQKLIKNIADNIAKGNNIFFILTRFIFQACYMFNRMSWRYWINVRTTRLSDLQSAICNKSEMVTRLDRMLVKIGEGKRIPKAPL